MYEKVIGNLRTEKYDPQKHVLCDRQSIFGNPFKMTKESERDDVCDKFACYFRDKFLNSTSLLEELRELAQRINSGKKMMCWCYPRRCHCETIIDYLRSQKMIAI